MKIKAALNKLNRFQRVQLEIGPCYVWLKGSNKNRDCDAVCIGDREDVFQPITTAERRKWADKILQELTK